MGNLKMRIVAEATRVAILTGGKHLLSQTTDKPSMRVDIPPNSFPGIPAIHYQFA